MSQTITDSEVGGLAFLRVYICHASEKSVLQSVGDRYHYVFAYSLADLGELKGFSRASKWTQLLTLTSTPEELFSDLHKNNQYKINRSRRDDRVEVVVDDPNRDSSYDFYRSIKISDGVAPDIKEDFASTRWINAYHREELVSATSWFDSGQVLRAKHIVSVRKQRSTDAALMGRLTRRLFWEACVYGLNNNYRYVDLGGLDPHDPSKKGVADFKRSFGGKTAPVYIYRHATPQWQELTTKLHDEGLMVV